MKKKKKYNVYNVFVRRVEEDEYTISAFNLKDAKRKAKKLAENNGMGYPEEVDVVEAEDV